MLVAIALVLIPLAVLTPFLAPFFLGLNKTTRRPVPSIRPSRATAASDALALSLARPPAAGLLSPAGCL